MESTLNSSLFPGVHNGSAFAASRTWRWIGRVLTGLCAAFLLVDAVGKLLMLPPYVEGTRQLGYAIGVLRPLGVVLALSTVLHLLPRTQLVGALLLTAYLGGATATLVRMGQPLWFPVTMGAILWIAYALRSASLRAIILSRPLSR